MRPIEAALTSTGIDGSRKVPSPPNRPPKHAKTEGNQHQNDDNENVCVPIMMILIVVIIKVLLLSLPSEERS